MDITLLQYPIGKLSYNGFSTDEIRKERIDRIASLPQRLREVVIPLSEEQLDTPYRPGGWTLRQVIHHVPDSHINAYVRLRWTLTEETPRIKAYDENAWSQLPDYAGAVEPSLALLEAVQLRFVALWRALDQADWSRSFIHPETDSEVSLDLMLAQYAWHGDHHLAHVTHTAERLGW